MPYKYSYGLFYANKLVAAMYFMQGDADNTFVLQHYCVGNDVMVTGGCSRLFKAFVDSRTTIDTIEMYADARWDFGNTMEEDGFTLISVSEPLGYAISGDKRVDLSKYMADGIDETAALNRAIADGKHIIYDCGQYKYVWRRNPVGNPKEAQ